MNLPDIESLRCFVEAARLLNFRAAARTVAITPAAFGQRIKRLEDLMGVELFQRTTRRVVLTEAGLALLPRARQALEAVADCTRAARGEGGPLAIELTLGTRQELGVSWVIPALPALRRAHPGILFHLYFGSGSDLEARVRTQEVDCAISSRRLTDPAIDFVRLHPEHYVFVGSCELLGRQPLDSPEDAAAHTLIDTTAELPLFRYWRDAPGGHDSMTFGRLMRMGAIAAIERLVLDGEGVAVLPRYLVQPRLDAGELQAVLPGVEPLHDWFRLIFRADDPRASIFRKLAETLAGLPLS